MIKNSANNSAMKPPTTTKFAFSLPQTSLIVSVAKKVIEYPRTPAGTKKPKIVIILFAKMDDNVRELVKIQRRMIKILSFFSFKIHL